MKVITKKYKLDTTQYIKLAMTNVIKEWWWAFLVPIALASLTIFFPGTHWFWISALIITVLYLLFWLIQFAGVTQLEQFKVIFEKLSYEIDSRQILMKINPKQGMPLQWDNIKNAKRLKDGFLFIISKAQLIYLPNKAFNNQNDIKFVESILKRKGFVK